VTRHGPYRTWPKADGAFGAVMSAFWSPKSRRAIPKHGHSTAEVGLSAIRSPQPTLKNGPSGFRSVRFVVAPFNAQTHAKLKSP